MFVMPASVLRLSKVHVNTQCERLDSLFMFVCPTWRFVFPFWRSRTMSWTAKQRHAATSSTQQPAITCRSLLPLPSPSPCRSSLMHAALFLHLSSAPPPPPPPPLPLLRPSLSTLFTLTHPPL